MHCDQICERVAAMLLPCQAWIQSELFQAEAAQGERCNCSVLIILIGGTLQQCTAVRSAISLGLAGLLTRLHQGVWGSQSLTFASAVFISFNLQSQARFAQRDLSLLPISLFSDHGCVFPGDAGRLFHTGADPAAAAAVPEVQPHRPDSAQDAYGRRLGQCDGDELRQESALCRLLAACHG